ncbi:MAG: condensation domain-containing protein, partial [Longimicrobiaceae bacterium]
MENVYPLSPVQAGILFHELYSPDSGAYLNQYTFSLRGSPDPELLRRAWQHVLDHSPVLRTAFVWEGIDQAVQVVFRRVALPWTVLDLRGCPPNESGERLRLSLEAQRQPSFDLRSPPLMRVALVRTGDEEHELVWTFHHLLLDGWSIPLVLQDVLASYDGLRRGRAPVLPRRRPYHDYIAWLQRQDLRAAEAYWRGALEDLASGTQLGPELAPDRAAPAAGQPALGAVERLLGAGTSAGLQAFARQQRLTVNTLVQGAWGLLLSRYSGEEDVVFGGVVTGRSPELAAMEGMVGLFINTLPVRVRVEGETRVDEWLRRQQAQQQEARRYEYSPLSEVQRWSGVPAGTPLFESIVAFENHPVAEMEGSTDRGFLVAGWTRSGTAHYPITLVVMPGERTSLQLEYDGGRVAAEAAERMVDHLEAVLEAIVADPARRLSELSLLRGAERVQLLEEWTDTARPYPDLCLHELVAAQSARTPDAVALVFEGESLSYAALEARSNQLARYLAGLGAGPEIRVGVCAERSLELVVALLAVLKAGAAYVPLDPSYPAERLAYMLEDSGVPVLLTQERLLERMPTHDARIVCVDGHAGWVGEESAEPLPLRADADSLAYVIYTSGSTGRPKGAMNAHRGIVNRMLWMQDEYELTSDDVVLQKTPFSFDVSVWEFFWPLLTGARLVLA